MKMTRIFLLGMAFLVGSLYAQDSDFQQVETTLQYYLQGGTNNDFATLKKAFHAQARMKFIGDTYKEVNALEFFEKGMKPGPPQDRQTRISQINISGNAAAAKLEIEYEGFTFIDHMTLLKIEGEWKIVSKVFYKKIHESK